MCGCDTWLYARVDEFDDLSDECALRWVVGEEGRLGFGIVFRLFFEVFADGDRLSENCAIGQYERRHLLHRVHLAAERFFVLRAAVFDEMHRDDFVRDLLQLQHDPHPPCRRAAPVGIQLQFAHPRLSCS